MYIIRDGEKIDKRELVAEKAVEHLKQTGEFNITKAAQELGYHERSANGIIKSESFKRALFHELPYELIVRAQAKQLRAANIKEVAFVGIDTEDEALEIASRGEWEVLKFWRDTAKYTDENGDIQIKEVIHAWVATPNWEQQDRALDHIYKIGGLYSAEKMEITTPLEELPDDELDSALIDEGIIVDSSHEQAKIEEVKTV